MGGFAFSTRGNLDPHHAVAGAAVGDGTDAAPGDLLLQGETRAHLGASGHSRSGQFDAHAVAATAGQLGPSTAGGAVDIGGKRHHPHEQNDDPEHWAAATPPRWTRPPHAGGRRDAGGNRKPAPRQSCASSGERPRVPRLLPSTPPRRAVSPCRRTAPW